MTDLGGRGAHPRAVRPAGQTADLPPGYPQEYLRLVTLRDGRSVLIRPIQPSDAPALAEAIESADANTVRRRFLGGHPQVTPELLDYLTTVDYASRFALVAVEPASQRGVAIARYEPAEQDGTADVAIAVTPGWRDVGLAAELLRMLAQAAGERGIHTFTGTYLADNRPVTALINDADMPADQVTSRGIAEFSVPLAPDRGPQGTDTRGHRGVAGQADRGPDRPHGAWRATNSRPRSPCSGRRGRRGCRWPPGR